MIAKRMKLVVENSGETQTSVAEHLGISQPRLNQYLNGKREADYAFVYKFCRYFHTTPNYLFDFDEPPINGQAFDCIANIIERVDSWVENHKVSYSAAEKAELIRLIFPKINMLPDDQQRTKISDFLEVYHSIRKSN